LHGTPKAKAVCWRLADGQSRKRGDKKGLDKRVSFRKTLNLRLKNQNVKFWLSSSATKEFSDEMNASVSCIGNGT